MAKADQSRRGGIFEFKLRFAPAEGGAPVEEWATPAMWAAADEWADKLRATGEHTESWVSAKMADAVRLQAAQAAGLVSPGGISLERIMEMNNAFDVEDVADGEPADEDGANPTKAAGEA